MIMKKLLSVFLLLLCAPLTQAAVTTPTSLLPAKVRAVHFVLRAVSVADAKHIVDVASAAGFNTIQVTISDGVKLDNAPWTTTSASWKKADFIDWVSYTKSKGLIIVPELKLLTHQEKLFQNLHPELMYNSLTYDPRNTATYQRVFALIDEIIAVIQPSAFSIGHDEVAGRKPSKGCENMLPAALFLQDTLRLHDYFKARNIQTWMWGDMLISTSEFPQMKVEPLHGDYPGYGKAMRDKLPKDIVIGDWHYGDNQLVFPSLTTMQNEGFQVIGATWQNTKTINNFSRYAAQQGARGMMATTWFHVQRKEWTIVDQIIRDSAAAFNRDFH
jgi:hypothetical protein